MNKRLEEIERHRYVQQDKEANAFALALLMPMQWIVEDFKKLDFGDNKQFVKLCNKYGVSYGMLMARYGMLKEMKKL